MADPFVRGGARVRGGLLGVGGHVRTVGIRTLGPSEDMFEDDEMFVKTKRSNPSVDKKRCINNLENAVKRMIEICGISVLASYHNQDINKLEIVGDNQTINNLNDATKKSLDDALAKSYQAGCEGLEFVSYRKLQMNNIESLNENDKVNACHLPKTDFRLLSEKEKFIKHNNNGHLKKAFTSMFKAEGFGRGTSTKGGKYGKTSWG